MFQRYTLAQSMTIVDKLNKLPSTKGTIPGKTRILNLLLNALAVTTTAAVARRDKVTN